MDIRTLAENNRLVAFQHFVKEQMKQNPDTVERNGDVFSYQTKRGITKSYKAYKCFTHGIKGIFKVQGFWFAPIN